MTAKTTLLLRCIQETKFNKQQDIIVGNLHCASYKEPPTREKFAMVSFQHPIGKGINVYRFWRVSEKVSVLQLNSQEANSNSEMVNNTKQIFSIAKKYRTQKPPSAGNNLKILSHL